MKTRISRWVLALICLAVVQAQAEPFIESVQQKLKEQGFYYGEITGTKDAETTAALRRYQIRNGLQVSGELNTETQKSLGLRGSVPAAPRSTPAPSTPPRIPPRPVAPRPTVPPSEEAPDLRGDEPAADEEDVPRPTRGPEIDGGVFDGTPYEDAGAEVQQEVIAGAQSVLARRGYYRSEVDGVFGSGTAFALRAYQSRFGLDSTGRLDTETLAALSLLPEQRSRGLIGPQRRIYRPIPRYYAPNGEPVYVPR